MPGPTFLLWGFSPEHTWKPWALEEGKVQSCSSEGEQIGCLLWPDSPSKAPCPLCLAWFWAAFQEVPGGLEGGRAEPSVERQRLCVAKRCNAAANILPDLYPKTVTLPPTHLSTHLPCRVALLITPRKAIPLTLAVFAARVILTQMVIPATVLNLSYLFLHLLPTLPTPSVKIATPL